MFFRAALSRLITALLFLAVSIIPDPSAFAQDIRTSNRSSHARNGGSPPYKKGELLVKYKPSGLSRSLSRKGAVIASTIKTHRSIGVSRVRLTEGTDVNQALEALRNDPDVEYAEPNYQYQACVVPNDPSFPEQWGLGNIDAADAWGITSGTTTVVVAVVDTGVCYTHPDLVQNMWSGEGGAKGWDFVDEDNDPADLNGHGTHVAGIIAGVGNNSTGIVGVTWSAKIMPVRGLNASGSGYVSDLIEGIVYAGANGAHVINCSWGGTDYSQSLKDAISASPALVVCAAGNNGTNNSSTPFYPAGYNCPNLIAVAATDQSDNLASFSNFGPTSVDVAAPGVNILSTYVSSSQPAYARMSGTSMAAPHVSGIAALVKAQNPPLTGVQIKQAIVYSVDKMGSLSGKLITGGRVNALKALPPATPTGLYISKISADKIDLSWTDNAVNEIGFRIERKVSGGGWSQMATTAANVTTYTDTWGDELDLQYRVLAYNTAADSPYSNTAIIDNTPPTATLTYSAPDLNHVDAGTLVITAASGKTLVAPAISIKRPGAMSTISGSMNGIGTVWTYNLNISRYNGTSVLDGQYTVSLDTQDLLGNSLGQVKNTKFITDTKDFDNDGIRDYDDPDDDNDGLPDEWEIRMGLNPQDAQGVNGWDADSDNDGWTNGEEYQNNTEPKNAVSRPLPDPPVIKEVNPRDNSGVTNAVRIPGNTAFAVRFEAPRGMALNGFSGVTLAINDGVTTYTRGLNETNAGGVTLVQAVPLDTGTSESEKLWVVYYRANETGVTAVYPYEAVVGVSVYATDVRKDSMVPTRFSFQIEGVTDFIKASQNSPETKITVQSGITKVEVDKGSLLGAAILYDESVERTGVTPYFGPSDEIPALNVSGANGVGAPMNLKPPLVFPEGVILQIPAPGYSDVSSLCVYYYNGENWVVACNAAGQVQPGGEGWMIPGSRVNHNNGSPSTIEIGVYHFSGAMAGSAPPSGGGGGDGGSGGGGGGGDGDVPGGSGTASGGGSGGGGGCFINTLMSVF